MTEKVRLVLTILLCSALSTAQNPAVQAPSLANAIKAAQKAFPAPGASWTVVEQPFWPNHTLVKLSRAADERWYHRPTVAVNALGKAYVLTYGAVRISKARILKDFNTIAQAEQVALSDDELDDYASFFLAAHLVNSDHHCLRATRPEHEQLVGVGGVLPEDVCREDPGFRLLRRNKSIQVETVLVHRKGQWATPYSFLLRTDGKIERIGR